MEKKTHTKPSGYGWGKVTVDALNSFATQTSTSATCKTILFNCNCHFFEEATDQIQKATGCSHHKAEILAHVAETQGKAVVFEGSEEDCEKAASVLREIELSAIVTQ